MKYFTYLMDKLPYELCYKIFLIYRHSIRENITLSKLINKRKFDLDTIRIYMLYNDRILFIKRRLAFMRYKTKYCRSHF